MAQYLPVNVETGEISADHYARNKRQDDGWKRKQKSQQGRQRIFTNSDIDNIPSIISELTNRQLGFLLLLQTRVDYDGVIRNANKTPMSRTDMQAYVNAKQRTFYDFLDRCMSLNIIDAQNGKYSVNPTYHWRGNMNGRSVVKTLTTQLKRVYTDVKPEDLGMVYRMLPYIHWRTNRLCHNPRVKDAADIKPMKGKELAEALGVNPKYLYTKASRLQFGGEPVFAQLNVLGVKSYYVNPKIAYRNDGSPDETLTSMFTVK